MSLLRRINCKFMVVNSCLAFIDITIKTIDILKIIEWSQKIFFLSVTYIILRVLICVYLDVDLNAWKYEVVAGMEQNL